MKLRISKIFAILSALFIVGFVLRLYHLGATSLWYDEIRTVDRVSYPFLETIMRLYNTPFAPLHYMIMNIWIRVFGHSEFAVRFPSLIFSSLSIILIYKLGKELFDEKTGLVAAFLLSISPYAINYAQDAKMYSLLWFLSVLSFLFFFRFIRKERASGLLPYVIVTALSLYAMYIGFLFLIIQNIAFFLLSDKSKRKEWIIGQLKIFLLYLPWMVHFMAFLNNRPQIQMVPKTENYAVFFARAFLLITGSSIGKIVYAEIYLYILLIMFVLIDFVIIINKNKRINGTFKLPENYCVLILWIMIPVVGFFLFDYFVHPILQIRYLGLVHIPLILLFSSELNKFNILLKRAALFFLAGIIISCHLYPYYKNNLKISGEDWRRVATELHKRLGDNDLIFSTVNPSVINYYDNSPKKMFRGYFSHKNGDWTIFSAGRMKITGDIDSIFIPYKHNKPQEFRIEGYEQKEDCDYDGVGFLVFKRKSGDMPLLSEKKDASNLREDNKLEWELEGGRLKGKVKFTYFNEEAFEGECSNGFEYCKGTILQKDGRRLGAEIIKGKLIQSFTITDS